MKRALGWIAGLVGIAALGRWLAGRATRVRTPRPAGADPAAELRRRLDATRIEDAAPGGPELEPKPEAAEPDERSLEERRSDVHRRAQDAIDAMRESGL